MWCHDPFLDCLKSCGYSVVRVPRADLAPLQLLLRDGREMERLGDAVDALIGDDGFPSPKVKRDLPAPAISGRRTGSLDAGIGVSFLGAVLSALAGHTVDVAGACHRVTQLTFTFDEVLEDAVSLVDLDAWLAEARVAPRHGLVARLLEADDLYLTTAIVKSRRFTMEANGETGAEVQVDVPLLQWLVGAQVKVVPEAGQSTRIGYSGRTPLGFGFRAVRLFFAGGRFTAFRPLPPGEAALSRSERRPDWLVPEQGFARVR